MAHFLKLRTAVSLSPFPWWDLLMIAQAPSTRLAPPPNQLPKNSSTRCNMTHNFGMTFCGAQEACLNYLNVLTTFYISIIYPMGLPFHVADKSARVFLSSHQPTKTSIFHQNPSTPPTRPLAIIKLRPEQAKPNSTNYKQSNPN